MKLASKLLLICLLLSLGVTSEGKISEPYSLKYQVRIKSSDFGDMGTRTLWIKGSNMRWEADNANFRLRLVKNNQGLFLIHPWNKMAGKYPKGTTRENPLALLPGPAGPVQKFLKSINAKKTGQETINKQPCNVYTYSEPICRKQCKLWVGTKSKKPVKLIVMGQKKKADTLTVTYISYTEGIKIADSQFEVPKGYVIRPMPNLDRQTGKKLADTKKAS